MTAVMGPLAWKARRDRALRWVAKLRRERDGWRASYGNLRAVLARTETEREEWMDKAGEQARNALGAIGRAEAADRELRITQRMYADAIDKQNAAVAHMNAAGRRAEEAHRRAVKAEGERDEARAELYNLRLIAETIKPGDMERAIASIAKEYLARADAAEAALSRAREALVAIKAASDALHADAAEARSEGMPPRFRVTSRLDDAIEAGAALAALEPSPARPEQHDDHDEHTTMAGHEEELP